MFRGLYINPVHEDNIRRPKRGQFDPGVPVCGQRKSLCGCESLTCPIETSAFLPPTTLFFFIFLFLFNSEATMTGDKLAISPRATHRGEQKMNCPRSILYSLSQSLSAVLHRHTAKHAPREKKRHFQIGVRISERELRSERSTSNVLSVSDQEWESWTLMKTQVRYARLFLYVYIHGAGWLFVILWLRSTCLHTALIHCAQYLRFHE